MDIEVKNKFYMLEPEFLQNSFNKIVRQCYTGSGCNRHFIHLVLSILGQSIIIMLIVDRYPHWLIVDVNNNRLN